MEWEQEMKGGRQGARHSWNALRSAGSRNPTRRRFVPPLRPRLLVGWKMGILSHFDS
jgi:hypothetical protein